MVDDAELGIVRDDGEESLDAEGSLSPAPACVPAPPLVAQRAAPGTLPGAQPEARVPHDKEEEEEMSCVPVFEQPPTLTRYQPRQDHPAPASSGCAGGTSCGAVASDEWCCSPAPQGRVAAAAQGSDAGVGEKEAAASRGLPVHEPPVAATAATWSERDLLSAYLSAGIDDSISRLLMGGKDGGAVGNAVLMNFEVEPPQVARDCWCDVCSPTSGEARASVDLMH